MHGSSTVIMTRQCSG